MSKDQTGRLTHELHPAITAPGRPVFLCANSRLRLAFGRAISALQLAHLGLQNPTETLAPFPTDHFHSGHPPHAPVNLHAVAADFDLCIVGGGFAGSLLAAIARRLGRSVVLIERGRHPRFVIGESSTPLANLLLEEIALRHDLPRLLPLCKWGTWRHTYPHIGCGLKRGFSFYHHTATQPWHPDPLHSRELLVAASPSDPIADTHWFRPDFDAFLFSEAAQLGVETLEETHLDPPEFSPASIRIRGRNPQGPVSLRARLLIDASGPRGFLHQSLGLQEPVPPTFPETHAVFGHFENVTRWDVLHPPAPTPPYAPDDAALHHLFDDGWMWVLRFANGLVSAGFARTGPARSPSAESEWRSWLDRCPDIARCFESARPVRPLTSLPRLAFRTSVAAGPRWAMLPIAAGFVDPLLSTGFTLSLLGIQRIATLLENIAEPDFDGYASTVLGDLDATFTLVGALYRALPDFDSFRQLAMLYFTSAIWTETARRLGRPECARGFLLRDDPEFSRGFQDCLRLAGNAPAHHVRDAVRRTIEPFNLGGLADDRKQHWYGCDAADLFASAHRIGASHEEIRSLLQRAGFPSG